MTDSLILAGQFELAALEQAAAQTYILGGGYGFGDPVPIVEALQSLVLDGAPQTGRLAGNRTLTLPVVVTATSRSALTAAVNALLAAVDAPTFTLQWTPDGGLPVVWDCYRVSAPKVGWDQRLEQTYAQVVTLSFSAAPYGRSTVAQTIASGGATVQVDSMDTAPTGATLDTSFKDEGTGSAKTAWASGDTTKTISRSISTTDMSGYVSLRVRCAHDGTNTRLTATLTLTDTGARTYTIPADAIVPASGGATAFVDVYFTVASGAGTAVLSMINKWSIRLTRSWLFAPVTANLSTPTIPAENSWLDDLRGLPSGSALTATARGTVLLVPGVQGSARAPGTFTVSRAAKMSAALIHRPPVEQQREAQILVGLSSTVADQTVTVPAPTASWEGTYTLVLAVKAAASAGVASTVEIGFTETWGTTVSVTLSEVVYTYSYTSLTRDRLLVLGEVTLPTRHMANRTHMSSNVRVTNTAGGGRHYDLMFLDTRGQTVLLDGNLPFPSQLLRVTEPDPTTGFGDVQGLYSDNGTPLTPPWDDAVSLLDVCTAISGGPALVEPGANKLLVYATDGVPAVSVSLYPRWLAERVV